MAAPTLDHFGTDPSGAPPPALNPPGTEMVKKASPRTPPDRTHDGPVAPDSSLSLVVAHQNMKQTQDVVRLEHALRQSQQRIAQIEQAVRNDLRTLRAELAGLSTRRERDGGFDEERGDFGLPRAFGGVAAAGLEPGCGNQVVRDAALRRPFASLAGRGDVLADTPTHAPARRMQTMAHMVVQFEGEKPAGDAAVMLEQGQPDVDTEAADSTKQQVVVHPRPPATAPSKPNTPPANPRTWLPHAVRTMPPSRFLHLADPDPETFTAATLHFILGGAEWSPGYYFTDTALPAVPDLLPSKSYWLIDRATEPFMPRRPGEHGAKMTAFFREAAAGPEEANYVGVPVFVSLDVEEGGEREYVYFGMYSRSRVSDRMDFDRAVECVPGAVRRFWARELTREGRGEWVTRALMEHFWPRPRAEGGEAVEVGRGAGMLGGYARSSEAWEREARAKANGITVEMILRAFELPDAGEVPGLRLWWEYFECVGFDGEFYRMMCLLKHMPRVGRFVQEREAGRAGRAAAEKRAKGEADRARAPRQVEREVLHASSGRGGGEKVSLLQGTVVDAETLRKTVEPASSRAVNVGAPTATKDKPTSYEPEVDWPDWEDPTAPGPPATNPPVVVEPKMLTSEDLFRGWEAYEPPVRKEHPYFPSSGSAPATPALAEVVEGDGGGESKEELKICVTGAGTAVEVAGGSGSGKGVGDGGGSANGKGNGNGKRVPPHLRRKMR